MKHEIKVFIASCLGAPGIGFMWGYSGALGVCANVTLDVVEYFNLSIDMWDVRRFLNG